MVEELSGKIQLLKRAAIKENLTVITNDCLDYIINYISNKKLTNILEIGTGNGYSAIVMCLYLPNISITTIEKDKKRYLEAIKNIKDFNLEERITLIYNDALTFKTKEKYDLICFDGDRSINKELFEKFSYYLNPKGIIITNNTTFNGNTKKDLKGILNFKLRLIVKKVNDYILFLKENENYKTSFIEIDNGLAISEKK